LLDVMASLRDMAPGWSLHLIAPEEGPLLEEARRIGVATTIVLLPRALSRLGDSFVRGRGLLARRLLRAGMALPGYLLRLRRELRAIGPNIVHTNGFKPHVLGTLVSRRGVPVVWHVHDYVSTRPVMRRLMRVLASRGATAVANSQSVAADLRDVCGSSLRVQTVYNAVQLERYTPDGAVLPLDALAGTPPASDGELRVGLVATFARWKGHETFLRALAMVPRDLNVRAYVIGGGLYRTDYSQYTIEELRGMARELAVEDRVAFTGQVADSAAAYRALDVVVHASTRPEPFGLVIAEAMACGRAVIVSAGGGAAELIEPGVDALAFPPGDASALAKCIRMLATTPVARAQMGREARRTAERRFDRTRLASEIIPLYRSLMCVAS
jgi:glycosyltransferase involved in cell wall biosynthesis